MADIVSIAIAESNGYVYTWFSDWTVRAGTVDKFGVLAPSYYYSLPPGKTPYDIVSIGITGADNQCYVWYKDGTTSAGSIYELDQDQTYSTYTLPTGKQISDIVSISIGDADTYYVWYREGTVSMGARDMSTHESSQPYALAPGQNPEHVLSIAISKTDNIFYVWYQDGTISTGSEPNHLVTLKASHQYALRLILSAYDIRNLLNSRLGNKIDLRCTFMFSDNTYYCPPRADINRIVQKHQEEKKTYAPEKYDCDDFALALKYEFIRDAYQDNLRRYPHSLGMMAGSHIGGCPHALDVVVTNNWEVLFIEPQDGSIFPPRNEDGGIYFMYF